MLHPEAFADLDDIRDSIAAKASTPRDRVISESLKLFDGSCLFSRSSGHRRPDLTSRPLRFILVREYLIAYAPQQKALWVVAVMHGRRSPRLMTAILKTESKRSILDLATTEVFRNLNAMEVHFTPEQEAQLAQKATQAGTVPERLVTNVVCPSLDEELASRPPWKPE